MIFCLDYQWNKSNGCIKSGAKIRNRFCRYQCKESLITVNVGEAFCGISCLTGNNRWRDKRNRVAGMKKRNTRQSVSFRVSPDWYWVMGLQGNLKLDSVLIVWSWLSGENKPGQILASLGLIGNSQRVKANRKKNCVYSSTSWLRTKMSYSSSDGKVEWTNAVFEWTKEEFWPLVMFFYCKGNVISTLVPIGFWWRSYKSIIFTL